MLRRSLLLATPALLVTPAVARLGRPGASNVIQAPVGMLTNGYGTWTYRDVFAPKPSWAATPFYRINLNGKWTFGLPGLGPGTLLQLTSANGNNIYGLGGDQQWWVFADYLWQFVSSPLLVPGPVTNPPTTFNPPYTPSPDGTAIAGGTGTLTTADGVWSFGPANGGAYYGKLNGIIVGGLSFGAPYDQIQVNAHGQAFLHRTDQGWKTWESFAEQSSAGPVSGPIPTSVDFSPSSALPSGSSPVGTFVTAISVTTSNGSPFAGTLTVDNGGTPPGDLKLDPSSTTGPNLVIARSPITGGGQNFTIVATQNGCTFTAFFNINST